MERLAVILHGWPIPVNQSTKMKQVLEDLGYEVQMPEYLKFDCRFCPEEVVRNIKRLLGKQKPGLLVGVSLGGLIVPYVAREYPEAKLLIVASGYRFAPRMKWFKKAVSRIAEKGETRMVRILGRLPWWMWSRGYKWVQQVDKKDAAGLKEDLRAFGKSFKAITTMKQVQLAEFLRECDNSPVLKELKNQTLVVAGGQDKLMPVEQGFEISRMVKGSELVINGATHYRVLDEKVEEKIKTFVE